MISPADDIARKLAALSVGTLGGAAKWSISINTEPLSPAEAITVYDTGGGEPDTDEQDLFNPTFQVRVRTPSFPEAYAKQEAIRDLLILSDPLVTTTSTFVGIAMSSDILSLGKDDGNRFILVANYRAIRKRN